jgi:hypothetical protein
MAASSNCASARANQRAGRSGQKGGRRTATLCIAAPGVSSEDSGMTVFFDHVGVTNAGSCPYSLTMLAWFACWRLVAGPWRLDDGSFYLSTRSLPSAGWSLEACRLVNGGCAVEMPLLYPPVSLLATSQLPTSGGAIGAGTSHPASGPVVPNAAQCSGKALTSPLLFNFAVEYAVRRVQEVG